MVKIMKHNLLAGRQAGRQAGNVILRFMGFLFNAFDKIYHVSLREYKTHLIRKNNPGIRYIGWSTILENPDNIVMGVGSYVNGGELFAARDSHIRIGDNCMISYDVVIRTDMHNHNRLDIPMISQGITCADITIEDNVWIGYGAYIMPGTTIHKGAIVAAHAVVTRDVPEYSVVAGVPAKIVKSRES